MSGFAEAGDLHPAGLPCLPIDLAGADTSTAQTPMTSPAPLQLRLRDLDRRRVDVEAGERVLAAALLTEVVPEPIRSNAAPMSPKNGSSACPANTWPPPESSRTVRAARSPGSFRRERAGPMLFGPTGQVRPSTCDCPFLIFVTV